MAKSLVYFSAGVSGESRPSLTLARDGGHGLCRNAVELCNIVYEKDPANGTSGGPRVAAVAAPFLPRRFFDALRKWADRMIMKLF